MISLLLSCFVLFSGENIQLESQDGFLVLHHTEHKSLEEFSPNELLEWERMAAKLENVFQQVFGIGDYYRSILLEQGAPAAMNVVPVGSYDQDAGVNLLWEAKNMLWLMGGKKELIPPLQQEEIEKIQKAASEIFSAPLSPIPLVGGKCPLTGVEEGLHLVRDEWQTRFSQYFPEEIDPFLNINFSPIPPLAVEKRTECTAFCKAEVIERQKICEGEKNVVLVNYLPYTSEEHLLILPKRHVEKISGSTDEEILEKYQLVVLLRNRLHELFPDKKILLITKTGWKGNQTQNHLHDHIIVFDEDAPQLWMRNWLVEVTNFGTKRIPTLTDEEIKERRKKLF